MRLEAKMEAKIDGNKQLWSEGVGEGRATGGQARNGGEGASEGVSEGED